MATRTATVIQIQSPLRMIGSQDLIGSRGISTLALDTGDDGQSADVVCEGACKIHFSVSADLGHLLTVGSVVLTMSDGKIVTLVPVALPVGIDGTTVEVNVAGIILGLDLSTATHRGTMVRGLSGNGSSGPYAWSNRLPGVIKARLSLTKAATATVCTYTVTATVYQ